MTIKTSGEYLRDSGRVINLAGPDGNAFFLLGMAKNFCRQLGWSWEHVESDMTTNEYGDLVRAFEKHFGGFVTIILPPGIDSLEDL